MCVKIICCIFAYYFVFSFHFIPVDVHNIGNLSAFHHFSPERYGPYFILTKSIETCAPSRALDQSKALSTNMYVSKISRTQEEYKGYMYVPSDVVITEGVLKCFLTNGRSKNQLFEKRSKKPCTEGVYISIASFFFTFDTKTCTILKSNYTIQNVDVNKIIHLLTGENFVHETIGFNFEVFSNVGSVYCLNVIFESKPLKGKTLGRKRKNNTNKLNTTATVPEMQ